MKEYLTMIVWLTSIPQKIRSIKCAECDYLPHTSISSIRTCPENCYGEICFIVVNNHHNETLISGCINVDTETRTFFRDHAYCYQKKQYTICGCTTSDRCNSPQAPLSMFTFISTPFFEECQFVPKHDDQFFTPIKCNFTLKEDNFKSTELPLKAESMKDAKSVEMTTENERIRDMPSIITEMTTSHPMITYSTKSIEMSSNKSGHFDSKKNEINAEFIDKVVHSLLPSIELQHVIDPEEFAATNFSKFDDQIKEEAHEKVKICDDGNSSSRQFGKSRITILMIFSLLSYSYELPKLNFKKINTLS